MPQPVPRLNPSWSIQNGRWRSCSPRRCKARNSKQRNTSRGRSSLDYVNLGRTGLKVSRICLGCMTYGDKAWRQWVLDENESRPFIKKALELGINFFDTANVYSLGVSE